MHKLTKLGLTILFFGSCLSFYQGCQRVDESATSKPVAEKKVVAPHDDKAYSERPKMTKQDIVLRDARYGVTSKDLVIETKETKGGRSIPRKELEAVVRQVFLKLPHIKTSNENVSLIVETMIAESHGGKNIVSKDKKDLGIAQIRITSAKDTLEWLKYRHPDVAEAVMAFYDKDYNNSLYDNLKFNIPFSVAMCVTEYWRKAGGNYQKKIATLEARAKLWKTYYNSHQGDGTVNLYISRVKAYI